MPKPPPLPAVVLARVLRIANIDGCVLVFLAGGFAVISVFCADWLGALVGGLAATAGFIELRGRRKLKAGDHEGVRWLVHSQIILLTIILLYVAYQFRNYDPRPMLELIERDLADAQRANGLQPVTLAANLGQTPAQLLDLAKKLARLSYALVGVLSVGFQGGLAYYYHRKGLVIALALRKS
jgi:hypothetical protein